MDDPSNPRPTRLVALIAGFATLYLVWGSTYLGIKFAVETLPPLSMAGCRFLLAGGILYAIQRGRGVAAPTLLQWRAGAITGALLLVGGNGLVTVAQQTVPSGRAALILATTPLWIFVLALLFYRGDRLTGRVGLGLLLGFIGTTLLIKPSAGGQHGSLLGYVCLLIAPITWSVGTLEARRKRPAEDALMTSAMQMLAGGGMMLALGGTFGEWATFQPEAVSAKSVFAFLYLALVGGLVGFTTYAWLLRVAAPTALSTYAYVNPLVAVLLGYLVAGEVLEPRAVLAAALILGAVVLITLPRLPEVDVAPARGLWRLVPVQSLVGAARSLRGGRRRTSAPDPCAAPRGSAD